MGFFFEYASALYGGFLAERDVITVPEELTEIAKKIVTVLGWRTTVQGRRFETVFPTPAENREVMIGLSGGLDSAYQLHRLQDEGYHVQAVHVDGLNRATAGVEHEQAREIARIAGAEFIDVKFRAPKQAIPDNPFKNQLVLGMMLDIGIGRWCYRYALGSDWCTPLSESVIKYTLTDSIEVNRAFWEGVRRHYEAELIFIDSDAKKLERLAYLAKHHEGTLREISSCVSPLRYRGHLHELNKEKFGDVVWDGRCGSCYKCAMEYILLEMAGAVKTNEAYLEHCWDVLATSSTSHRPELFSKNLSLQERRENIRNYGS